MNIMNIRVIEFRPPKIAQVFVILALLLHWSTPLHDAVVYTNSSLAVPLGIGGFGVMMWAWWLFKHHDTAICPTADTHRLIESDIYRFSRNPMYLGMSAMLLGLAFWVGTLPFYVAALVYFFILNNVFCPYEENKLQVKFGEQYQNYAHRVRRWI